MGPAKDSTKLVFLEQFSEVEMGNRSARLDHQTTRPRMQNGQPHPRVSLTSRPTPYYYSSEGRRGAESQDTEALSYLPPQMTMKLEPRESATQSNLSNHGVTRTNESDDQSSVESGDDHVSNVTYRIHNYKRNPFCRGFCPPSYN